jgi:hypothetical protein
MLVTVCYTEDLLKITIEALIGLVASHVCFCTGPINEWLVHTLFRIWLPKKYGSLGM